MDSIIVPEHCHYHKKINLLLDWQAVTWRQEESTFKMLFEDVLNQTWAMCND
jgi:hypothetical protein